MKTQLSVLAMFVCAACGGVEDLTSSDAEMFAFDPGSVPTEASYSISANGGDVITHLPYWDGYEFNFPVLQPYDLGRTLRQRWALDSDGVIRNVDSGRCLEIIYGSTSEYAYAALYACHRWLNQQWDRIPQVSIIDVIRGVPQRYQLRNRNSGKCLTHGLMQVDCNLWRGPQLLWGITQR